METTSRKIFRPLISEDPGWLKSAVRFAKNAGRKSKKAKMVKLVLYEFLEGLITPEEAREKLRATQPWQPHSPINP